MRVGGREGVVDRDERVVVGDEGVEVAGAAGAGQVVEGFGGLFGGANADGLKGGLQDLFERFTGTGHDREARSWVETGPNQSIGTTDLEDALGADTVAELVSRTGLSREELLARLSSVLPTAVDTMTPDGRLPT